jgi:hypothetical protein
MLKSRSVIAFVAVEVLELDAALHEPAHGVPQDDLGIWSSPSGARVAWFRDPDGNTLSLTQLGQSRTRKKARTK